uniref:Putative chaperone protein DNAj n=1 Tax=Trypanosoma congolense (strain IL3000) TaxID=1068625 RepID=G0UW93_TRYCI|nr:putative chaperone protein DNAj [Trypanosoma congolense IL3000]
MSLNDIDDDLPPQMKSQTPRGSAPTMGAPSEAVKFSGSPKPVDLGDLFSDLTILKDPEVSVPVGPARAANVATEPQVVGSGPDDFDWITPAGSAASPVSQKNVQGKSCISDDPLESFFSAQATPEPRAAPSTESCSNLLDLTQPVECVRYSSATTLLEAFASQGKSQNGSRRGPTLADLNKGTSDNVVKARLLKVMNYYDILGVTPDATEDDIRRRFKKKALELHPDRAGKQQTPEEVELFKMITKAHEVLSDPEERAKYDAQTFGAASDTGPDGWWSPPR